MTETNLGKTKEEIIYELVLSLNKGDSYYIDERVNVAMGQYDKLVEKGIVKEVKANENGNFNSRRNSDA